MCHALIPDGVTTSGMCLSRRLPCSSQRVVGIAVLRPRYRQIIGPIHQVAKLSDGLGRYFDVSIHCNRHLGRQATEGYVKRSAALGLVSHDGLRTLTTDCVQDRLCARCSPTYLAVVGKFRLELSG